MPPLQGEWLEALRPEFGKPYYKQLFAKVGQEYQTRKVCALLISVTSLFIRIFGLLQ